jgi:hypothetical protein
MKGRPKHDILRDQRGTTLVMVLILLLGFLSLAVGGLVSATSDLKGSRNYSSGMQALMCAESGLLHAQQLISAYGVMRFNVDVVPKWGTLWGNSAVSMPGTNRCSYTVTPTADPLLPMTFMSLTSTGIGPGGSSRTVASRLRLTASFSPGAIFLPDPDVAAQFNGNAFLIDGNDTNLDGTPGPSAPVPGIGTGTEEAAQNVLNELSNIQKDNVIGLGGDESVLPASGGASVDRINDEIVPGILAQAGVVTNPLMLLGNALFGTTLLPQITHFTSSITLNGTVSGAGILIVDGGLTVTGNMDFVGLIIVRGATEIDLTDVSGNASILGALWTTDLQVRVSGSASVTYSSQALDLANALGAATGANLIPQSIQTVAWTQL